MFCKCFTIKYELYLRIRKTFAKHFGLKFVCVCVCVYFIAYHEMCYCYFYVKMHQYMFGGLAPSGVRIRCGANGASQTV